jgi:hypothetical protein
VARNCSRCNAPRVADESNCRRCGLAFEPSATPDGRSLLVLRQVQPETDAGPWQVANTAALVGRGPSDIRLNDLSVSRSHALVKPIEGGFEIEDLDSGNGTYVNGRRVITPERIGSGDQIAFGDVLLVAEVHQPARVAMPNAVGATVMYAADGPPVVEPAPIRVPGPVRGVDVTLPDQPTAPPRAKKGSTPLRPADASSRAQSASGAPSLAELDRRASQLAAAVQAFDRQVVALLDKFEQRGGSAALRAFVDQARRVEANPRSAQDLETLVGWLSSARGLIETQLELVHLLSTRESDAGP